MTSQINPAALPAEVRRSLQVAGPVMIYGAGSMGRDCLRVLGAAGIRVQGFLDAKELPFAAIEGCPVQKPDSAVFPPATRRNTTVVIGIFNAFVNMSALHARLVALGWARIVTFMELHAAFAAEFGDRYWLTQRDYYGPFDGELAGARALLADDKSRAIFDGVMRFRRTGDYEALAPIEPGPQYFAADVPAWRDPLRVIDCGACDGDTFRHLRGRPMQAYAAFEPDPANFAALARVVAAPLEPRPSISALWPCGVWSHACQMRFATGQGAASSFTVQGDTVIQCAALDEVLPDFGPTLIKMDIEGAEYAALQGAARMIHAYRPGLAICVYHEPAHLWRIPALIAGWRLDYKFYLRSHGYSDFDLVLYAQPA